MPAKSKLGRTRAVPAIAFRVTDDQHRGLSALAEAEGLTVNEVARARAVAGLEPKDGVTPKGRSESHGVTPPRELAIEYDSEVARGR